MQPKFEMEITNQEIRIISGEGDYGFVDRFTGKKTQRAIKSRLTRERCNGDRWANAIQQTENECFGRDLEDNELCDWPGLD